ncbi:hypothetical protein Tco_0019704 [Tanacetum coccineum]
MEWLHNLRIMLSVEDKLPFLEQPIPSMPVSPVGQISKSSAYDMLKEPKTLYAQLADQELFQTSYIDNLERLGHSMTQNLLVSLILVSLKKEYDGFVQNYNIHSMGKTVTELHAMLKLHKQTLPPKEAALALYTIRA